MLILRQCGVPKMNYALRCTPPPCVAEQAAVFDKLVLRTATAKLLLHEGEMRNHHTEERLRAPLRHGGFGLTSALRTSPAAYLGSIAAVAAAPAFVRYSQPQSPLPCNSLLHGWVQGSIDAIVDESPECRPLLPTTASSFFQLFAPSVTPSSLQHQLSQQATESVFKASLQLAKEMKKVDEGLALTRLRAISAPRAWTWKVVAPTSKELELTDTEYRMSSRFNLGLMPIGGATTLPAICPLCKNKRNTISGDPWHFLSCTPLHRGEVNVRHDNVNRALYRCALLMGFPARMEPTGLDLDNRYRPDLLLTLPGRHILTDVAIVHSLAPGKVRSGHAVLGSAREMEGNKRRHYAKLVALHRYELLPFVMETSGGMGPDAERLVEIMAEAGEAHLRMWAKVDIIQELLHTAAIAVQRGGAVSYLHGYEQALRKLRMAHDASGARAAGNGEMRHEVSGEEAEEETALAA